MLVDNSVSSALNRVEFHPHYRQPDDMYTICGRHMILLQAYSSLGGSHNPKLLSDPVIVELATDHQVTPAQILLRWALQIGYAVIPKSVTPEYIGLNSQLNFTLSSGEIYSISLICCQEKYAWDPITVF